MHRRKNVRNDSLPADRRVAQKGNFLILIKLDQPLTRADCRTCQKRRIICDRTLPQCQKCDVRGFTCPGFPSIILRWDQGIASRGKFTGCKLPLLDEHKSPKKQGNNHARPLGHQTWISTISPSPVDDTELARHHISTSICELLLRHFISNVAPRLTWFDSPQNPWRSLILPLAKKSTCFRQSIMCLSSAHITAVSDRIDHSSAISQTNRQIREGTLHSLTQKMQSHMLETSYPCIGNASAFSMVEMLASMLALCYSEILIPNSKEWGLHLQACRVVIERHGLQTDAAQKQSIFIHFLVKEVSDLLACGNFSIFSRHAEYATAPYRLNISDTQSWGFLNLIDEITVIERLRYDHFVRNRSPPPVNMNHWYAKLDEAYEKAIHMLDLLPSCGKSQHQYSSAIVKAHYYAVSIYCYQALKPCGHSNIESRKPSIENLLETIKCATLEPQSAFAHDVFFPLFIAGTECQSDKARQQQIEKFFQESIFASGFWCNDAARRFLREFWESSSESGSVNWISFARKNEHEIGSFVVF